MSKAIEMLKRSKKIGKYIVENNVTITQTARTFGISTKSVHTSLDNWLRYVDKPLYEKAKKVFEDKKLKK